MKQWARILWSCLPTLAAIIVVACGVTLTVLALLPHKAADNTRHSRRNSATATTNSLQATPSTSMATKPVASAPSSHETLASPAHDTLIKPLQLGAIAPTTTVPTSTISPPPLASPPAEPAITLPPAPIAAVAETSADGTLPIIAEDGRQPWQVYARPFMRDQQPIIAVIVATLGADRELTNSAIDTLHGAITLAFDPMLAARDEGMARGRAAGHETMLVIPTEPQDYPVSDPGPETLLVALPTEKNQQRLQELLQKSSGYIGMMTLSGTRFATVPKAMDVLLTTSKERGLAMLDTKLSPRADLTTQARAMKVPIAAVDFRITAENSAAMIDDILAQAITAARKNGQAVCLVMATPLALDRLHHWQDKLANAGIRLAPLSALLQ